MTSQENNPEKTINLTPFEQALAEAVEFGENCIQSSMWFSMAEKLAELEGKDDPESTAQRFVIENFLSASVKDIPGLIQGEA